MGIADPLNGKGKLGGPRQMVLAAIIDYFNNSNGYFGIDRSANGPKHRINGWFSLGDLADGIVRDCPAFVRIHKDCGGAIVSDMFASDTDRDYFSPRCLACNSSPETHEMEMVII